MDRPTPRHQVRQLRTRGEEVRDRHGHDGQGDQVREHLEPEVATHVAVGHEQRRDDGRDHDAEPRDVLAVGLAEGAEEHAVLGCRVRNLGGDHRPAVESPDTGDHCDEGDCLADPGGRAEHRPESTVDDQLVVRHQAHDRCGDEHVQDSGGGGAVQGRLAYVDPRVLDPTGHDASGLNTDEREQRHTCGDRDGGHHAAAGRVERRVVVSAHEEPTHDTDEEQREELQHDGDVLEPRHLTHAGEVDERRDPQAGHGDPEVRPRGRILDAEERLDVQDPRRHDCRVAGPAGDPVAPGRQVAGEVTELVPGVRVQTTIAVRDPLRELTEHDSEQDRSERDDQERQDRDRAGSCHHGGHREDARSDDAADDDGRR